MAAPAHKNIKDLNGKWLMNKTHSDATDPVLALQGIGWLTRKAVGVASVTLHIKMYTKTSEDNPSAGEVINVDIDQFASGGIKGTAEYRALDWTYRPHSDWLFGELKGRSRFTTLDAVRKEAAEMGGVTEQDAEWLTEGWLEETRTGEVIESFVDNEGKGWTGWQIWGFAEINGERWYVRRMAIRRKNEDKAVRVKLCYEWVGELGS
ncbi:hypothetical protein BU23DRAFT_503777 [Bimuria novae-zelandiae CBS 107.79]|uniref:Lccl domain-containing protein n=1 Tax=Bimuria novae-zelandiae CBS 107.79 TaxID=1447943 RepID=A0A6A5VPJ3_9PLEO|nr:hypothetical protein BU23DRAFT_503777 [Bimuria novae-zelandiae CBS 107.79]